MSPSRHTPSFGRRPAFGLVCLVALVSACASVEVDRAAAGISSPLAAPGDEAAACKTYPVPLPVDPGAESRARAALSALAPEATASFARARGTFSSITGASVGLGQCPRGRSLDDRLRSIVRAHPDVFRIDPDEWHDGGRTCDSITDAGDWVVWTRDSYGGLPLRKDVVSFRVRKDGYSLRLTGLYGTYLPPADPEVLAELRACPTIDERAAEASAREAKHAFRVFDMCAPIRDLTYAPVADDAFELGASYVDWEDAASVAFSHHVEGALRVAPGNHTPDLIQSDANCPYLGVNRVGFALRFDAVSSKLAESKAGIDCVVCLR